MALAWWGNILGFHRLSENAGHFMQSADRGTGLPITVRLKRGEKLSNKLELICGASETDDGRVAVANHRPSLWNGAWDYSTGTDPNADYDGLVQDDGNRFQEDVDCSPYQRDEEVENDGEEVEGE
jgi:hypothetical protein